MAKELLVAVVHHNRMGPSTFPSCTPQNEIWPLLKVFLYLSPWFYSQELSMEFVYKNMSALCDFKGPNETKMPLLEEEMLKPEVDSVKVVAKIKWTFNI